MRLSGRRVIGLGLVELHGMVVAAAVAHVHGLLHIVVHRLLVVSCRTLTCCGLKLVPAKAHPARGKALKRQPQQQESDQEGTQAGSHGRHSRHNPVGGAIPGEGA